MGLFVPNCTDKFVQINFHPILSRKYLSDKTNYSNHEFSFWPFILAFSSCRNLLQH